MTYLKSLTSSEKFQSGRTQSSPAVVLLSRRKRARPPEERNRMEGQAGNAITKTSKKLTILYDPKFPCGFICVSIAWADTQGFKNIPLLPR
jgi:hypothetical protein